MPKYTTTLSYPRSGSHFIREALNCKTVHPGFKHTKTPYNITKDELQWFKRHNTIYIHRDARDAIVSLYYWMQTLIEEKPERFLRTDIKNLSFSNFLKGKASIKHVNEITQDLFKNPVRYWVQHTDWLNEKWFYDVISYEDALKKWTIKKLLFAGKKSKGIAGRWKSHFIKDDLKYFWNIAGKRMNELGYKK